MVLEPTQQGNIFYLVFASHPEYIDKTYVVLGMCLNNAMVFDLNIKIPTSCNPPRRVYVYKKAYMEGIRISEDCFRKSSAASSKICN